MEELRAEMAREIARSRKLARRNYLAAYVLFVISIGATVVAALVSASDADPAVRAALTTIPGAAVLINSTLKLQEKARWYWRRVKRIEAFVRRSKLANASVESLSEEYSAFTLQMEDVWPDFEPLPGTGRVSDTRSNKDKP